MSLPLRKIKPLKALVLAAPRPRPLPLPFVIKTRAGRSNIFRHFFIFFVRNFAWVSPARVWDDHWKSVLDPGHCDNS